VENSGYIFNSVEWGNIGYGGYILTTSYIPMVRENMKQGHRGENIRTCTLFASSSDKGYKAIDTRTPTISVQEANETTGKVPTMTKILMNIRGEEEKKVVGKRTSCVLTSVMGNQGPWVSLSG
jgi:hypothetical protein